MPKIAIDTMGLDLGSQIVVRSIKKYIKENKDVEFHVFGKEEELQELKGLATIYNCSQVMEMEEGALDVLRKKDSSMLRAISAVKDNIADGVISAGSTGAFLTGCTLKLRLIENISRAALAVVFPTFDGKGVLLLDIGASNENTPQHLLQFAQMGNVYMKNMRNIDKPNVYLISNGAEEKKGSPLTKEAYTLLKDLSYFKGNIEAREVLSGEADVVVCPGFEGNILLKTTEGTASMILKMVKKAFKKNLLTKLGYLFSAIGFKELKVSMDYKKYGGAMFVGVNGVAVKAHGNSDEEAFYHAIRVTHELIKAGIVHKLQEEFKNA